MTAVIPTFNEQYGIEWVLRNIPPWVEELVLIDGLSTDQTEALARAIQPKIVVVHQHARGKGAAVRAGFEAATSDIVVMLDADGSTDPREIPRFVGALVAGADFVKGSRSLAGGGSDDFTPLRRLGNRFFVALVRVLFGVRFTDLCYGYVAFWRHHLDALELTSTGFELETALALGAVKARLQIREVPSYELARREGKSNLHAFGDGLGVLREILKRRVTNHPDVPRIELDAVEKPSPQVSLSWLPAGRDRRRVDRRRASCAASWYRGPERRVHQRRQPVRDTVTVYVARTEHRGAPAEHAARAH